MKEPRLTEDVLNGQSLTPAAARNRRYRARLRGENVPLLRRKWTPEEENMMRKIYPTIIRGDGQVKALCERFSVTPDQLQEHAANLGLTNPRRGLSDELRQQHSREKVKAIVSTPHLFTRARTGANTAGHRADLGGKYFRSAWEANYARFLNFTGTKWEYEKKTFWFEKIKRGVRSYTPDFYLPEQDVYHEVKGWMDKRSATKLKRMKKYHPTVTVKVIDREFFKAANKQGCCTLIPGWECQHKKHNGTLRVRSQMNGSNA